MCREITNALAQASGKIKPLYASWLAGPFTSIVNSLSNRRGNTGHGAALMKVFLPYIYWNTVFDNSRVVKEMGGAPAPFTKYCFPLLRFSRENHFQYPYEAWPAAAESRTQGVGR
jgi:hypothetical protein